MKIQFNTRTLPLILAAGIFLASCAGNDHQEEGTQAKPVKVVMAVGEAPSGGTIRASGQIESKETAVISTRMMGFITSIKVKEGDKVQKGQLVATINNADIMAKKAQAQAMVAEAEAALADAKKDHERFQELYKQNSASTKELENATLHYHSLKAKAEAAKQMQNEVEAALTYTNLTAPFTGVITQKHVDVGSMANPGAPILRMELEGSYQVGASVSEADIALVKEGAKAKVLIKSTGRVINGQVSAVSPSSQFSGGQYGITVNLPDREKTGLYSGMYVNVAIESARLPLATGNVLVPASAILYKDQLTGLYTVTEDHTALLRWVRLGKEQGDHVEILSGLRSDEKFILESDGKLYNGVPVIMQ